MASYFEITISSRQLAVVVIGTVALVLVAFGLGVVVGVQEPVAARSAPAGPLAVAAEPTFVPVGHAATEEATPNVVDALRGDVEAAAASPTPTGPDMVPAPGAAFPVATEAPPTPVPTERPTVAPSPAPTRPRVQPSATEFPLPRLGRGVWVQVGALTVESGAQNLRRRVLQLGYTPNQVVVRHGSDGKYRVRVGPFPDEESAGRVVARLRVDGFPGAFTVRE